MLEIDQSQSLVTYAYDLHEFSRQTIPGTVIRETNLDLSNYSRNVAPEYITQVISSPPLVLHDSAYRGLVVNSGTKNAGTDCFCSVAIHADSGRSAMEVFASVSPTVVNYDHFASCDFTDIIPFAVKRFDVRVEDALRNFNRLYRHLLDEVRDPLEDKIRLEAEIEAMETALAHGKLKRYLEFYRRTEEVNSPIRIMQRRALSELRRRYTGLIDSSVVIFPRQEPEDQAQDDFGEWQRMQKETGESHPIKDIPAPMNGEGLNRLALSTPSPILSSATV